MYNSLNVLVAVSLVAVLAAIAMLFLRHKFRLVWHRLWQLEEKAAALEQGNIDLRKNIFLAGAPNLRLPARLPSQHGEDLLLWSFFGGRQHGFFVEVGAYDGVALSNTYFLEALGWSGILVEPNSRLIEQCAQARPFSRAVHAAISDSSGGTLELSIVEGEPDLDALSYVGAPEAHIARVKRTGGSVRNETVPRMTLDEVLGEDVTHVDLVSIDVEGHELSVLAGFSIDKYQPDILLVEDNSHGRDRLVSRFLADRGYVERHRTDCNVFYCRADEQRCIEFPPPGARIV